MSTKVFVGLSGGVDSATSAALLTRAGFDVTGVFIRIMLPGYPCPAVKDRQEAMRAAAHLHIPFREIDLSAAYKERVFAHMLRELQAGRTPNPDTLCNREIKFGLFFEHAMREGADMVATGHYAQAKEGMLYAGADTEKDQSYFLWMVPQEHLAKTLFPVGGMRKLQVRTLAQEFGLPNARRKDSQGLCFLGDISMTDMLERELKLQQGDVLSEAGEVIGRHDGVAQYTLGQRHGFTLFAHTPQTPAHYVVGKDAGRNTITVSEEPFPRDKAGTRIVLTECNWIGSIPEGELLARYRYRQELMPATLEDGNEAVLLRVPRYVPDGQSLVLYAREKSGLRCLGGGVILSSELC